MMAANPRGALTDRSEQAKKAEVIKEIQQLRIKIQNLEREKSTHLYARHSDFRKEFSQLQEQETRENESRKAEKVKLAQQVNKIKNMVKKFHRELKDVKPTPEFVEKLKVIMEEIECHISSFKEQQRQHYEEMLKEERLAHQEVMAFDRKFEAWSQLGAAKPEEKKISAPLPTSRDVTVNMPPEVREFEKFSQQTGGPRGGWDEYDHGTFLKYRMKSKGKLTFLKDLVSVLPTKTEQEIRDHEAWFQKYLNLNEAKKEAIQRWKERKENEKDQLLSQASESDTKAEDEKLKREERMREMAEEERKERRSQLNKWKIDKELKRAEEEEKKIRAEMEKAKAKEKEIARQLEAKNKVEEYRRAREEEKEFAEMLERHAQEEAKEEARMRQAENVQRFRQRDKTTVLKRLEQQKERQKVEEEREMRLERLKSQVEVKVVRDPSRLLKPTEGWKERQKDDSRAGGQLMHMPHRAVPTWRQGMS